MNAITAWNAQSSPSISRSVLAITNDELSNVIRSLTPSAWQAERFSAVDQKGIALPVHQRMKQPLAEQLYDVRMNAKIKTRALVNFLSREWQDKFFRQIDELHDLDDWEDADKPMRADSFDTFIKTLQVVKPSVRPGLGLTNDGNLVGSWGKKGDFLTIEFKPVSQLRLHYSIGEGEEKITSFTNTPVHSLTRVLAPYTPNHWWHRDGDSAPGR